MMEDCIDGHVNEGGSAVLYIPTEWQLRVAVACEGDFARLDEAEIWSRVRKVKGSQSHMRIGSYALRTWL